MKQISLTMPENLLLASKEYSKGYGYSTVQEFILDLVRNKVVFENIQRYKTIEDKMRCGKVKRFSQKEAEKYLKRL